MEEQLISFETAKLAKEKGFNIKCKNWYDQLECLNPVKGARGATIYTNEGFAPTQSLLQKWLREEHKIVVSVDIDADDKYFVSVGFSAYGSFDTWELALEDGLKEALTNLNTK